MVKYDPNKYHRRSIRLKHYDYTTPGAYFITMCIQYRLCLLGEIVDGGMICNDAGDMVARWWEKLPTKFDNVILGEYVVMPNHFHGIIFIQPTPNAINETVGATPRGRPSQPNDPTDAGNNSQTGDTSNDVGATTQGSPFPNQGQPHGAAPTITRGVTLGEMIGWFKTMTTNEYIRGVKELGWQPFNKHFWQRNYFESIIHDDESLSAISNYILYNPKNWLTDKENKFILR